MPFLYDPKDNDFDVGDFASSWSFPEADTVAESNTSIGTRENARPFGIYATHGGPVSALSVQGPSQSGITRVRTRRMIVDATSPTSRQPTQIMSSTVDPPRLTRTSAHRTRIAMHRIEALLSTTDIASIEQRLQQFRSVAREQRQALREEQLARQAG